MAECHRAGDRPGCYQHELGYFREYDSYAEMNEAVCASYNETVRREKWRFEPCPESSATMPPVTGQSLGGTEFGWLGWLDWLVWPSLVSRWGNRVWLVGLVGWIGWLV